MTKQPVPTICPYCGQEIKQEPKTQIDPNKYYVWSNVRDGFVEVDSAGHLRDEPAEIMG